MRTHKSSICSVWLSVYQYYLNIFNSLQTERSMIGLSQTYKIRYNHNDKGSISLFHFNQEVGRVYIDGAVTFNYNLHTDRSVAYVLNLLVDPPFFIEKVIDGYRLMYKKEKGIIKYFGYPFSQYSHHIVSCIEEGKKIYPLQILEDWEARIEAIRIKKEQKSAQHTQ